MNTILHNTSYKTLVLATFLAGIGMSGSIQAKTSNVQSLLDRHSCMACHALEKKVVGPSFKDIADRYAGKTDYLAKKIQMGSTGIWGPIPMPAQTAPEPDIRIIAAWLANGMK